MERLVYYVNMYFLKHKSALCARKDGYQLPLSRTLSQQGAAPVPPPSQKYDANSTYTSEPQQRYTSWILV